MHNNIIFAALLVIDPVLYQLFNNMKILTTAIVFRVLVNKRLRVVQWIAILMLMLGMVAAQLEQTVSPDADPAEPSGTGGTSSQEAGRVSSAWGSSMDGNARDVASGETSTRFLSVASRLTLDPPRVHRDVFAGFLGMLAQSSCSAFAGVYNEVLIKGTTDSVYWQNVLLYTFSSLLCSVQLLLRDSGENADDAAQVPGSQVTGYLIEGFDGTAWAIVLVNGLLGQFISLIYKYGDNIVKVFASSTATFCTAPLALYFGTPMASALFVGASIAMRNSPCTMPRANGWSRKTSSASKRSAAPATKDR